ncbi:MAG: M23 family metallopeptidase [Chloroflexi bacterium]|nr:M23 family metallopeptidase [Chloroflexota bacterium]
MIEKFPGLLGAVLFGIVIGVGSGLAIIIFLTRVSVASYSIVALPVPTETATTTAMLTPTATPTYLPTISPTRTASPRPKPALVPIWTPQPVVEHFLFGRPLALDASASAPNSMYLYGTTELGKYEVHHGVDFDRNPIGVPVYAVGDGVVVSAGDDREPLCGDDGKQACGRSPNYYGLVVVIKLDKAYRGQTLFAQYGHLDRIDVKKGQRVKQNDLIGTVGMTGIAIGPHVHFEIRVGANDYASTRNPMLWITPLPGRGVLAGRYIDGEGNPIHSAIIDIYRAEEPTKFYRETETYGIDEQPNVNADDQLGENFVMSDLPAGEYIVRVPGKQFAARLSVPEGGLGWIVFGK